jgi:hypothetical protein
MITAIRTGVSRAFSLLPFTEIDKSIFWIYLPSALLYNKRVGRLHATLATLPRSNNTPFLYWFNNTLNLEHFPHRLLGAHVSDLIHKVICACAFYFTAHLSFHTIAKNLCCHSEKISTLVLPILEKLSKSPVCSSLPSARLIAFAPVVTKLIQMALIYQDPKEEVFKTPKTFFSRISQYLESLWNLRFALLCLSISKTPSTSAVLAFCEYVAVKRMLTSPFFPLSIACYLACRCDLWPTAGLQVGLQGLFAYSETPSKPYDKETLSNLFEEAINLQWTSPQQDSLIATGLKPLENYISKILEADNVDTINLPFSDEFYKLALQQMLSSMLLHPSFKGISESEEELIKKLYSRDYTTEQTQNLIDLLKNVRTGSPSEKNLDETNNAIEDKNLNYAAHIEAILCDIFEVELPSSKEEIQPIYQSIKTAESELQKDPAKIQDFLNQQLQTLKTIAESFNNDSITPVEAYTLEALLYLSTTNALSNMYQKYDISEIQPSIEELYKQRYSQKDVTQLIECLTTFHDAAPTGTPGSATHQQALINRQNSPPHLSALKYIQQWPAPSIRWLLITNGSHYTSPLTPQEEG